jgi:hypothetical protein
MDKTAEPKDAYGAPGADKKIMEATSILDNSINPDMDNIAALSREDPDEPSNSNAHERFSKDDIKESIEKDECLESNAHLKNE